MLAGSESDQPLNLPSGNDRIYNLMQFARRFLCGYSPLWGSVANEMSAHI